MQPQDFQPYQRLRPQARRAAGNVAGHALILGVTVVVLWGLEIADLVVWHGGLDAYGIRPRTWQGLGHILTAPFFHVGFAHLAANTLPLVILGWLVMLRRTADYVVVALVSALASGLGIWLLGGSRTIHLGASGVIFGFLGYLVARAYFERSLAALILALVAGMLYGGLIWGVLPGQAGVSWLGHFFGLVGGGLAAFLLADRDR